MTTLLLVRHGETDWNRAQRLQGRTDIELSERGRADVAALRALIAPWHPATVIASPLARARMSAALLSDLEPIVDDAWIEHGLGDWEGATPAVIGPAYHRWRAGALVPPGGEPAAAIRKRVSGAVRTAVALPGPVLVVTHGGTIRAVLDRFLGLGADRIDPVSPASLTVVDVEGEGARLRQFNALP
ncbi:histidine phosphatase family protein [Leucobacter sp. wl10]|uniref:histidine phosphatase family protein n=1 Tax=Leucobacter sp. wl10 TaxID=2304677 RepID=UPI000E5B8140|nr:histidine phosphatase family protein [Leucobacter sp. wl10]RGE19386.1 histidine phosphatase family protein [Leucobacter sp. wl10]